MAHLTRIFFKTTQAQKCGPILPDRITRRYVAHKKSLGLKLKMETSSLDVISNERNATLKIPDENYVNCDESKNMFGRRGEFYPEISECYCKSLKSITGVSLGPYSIGWCKLDLQQKSLQQFGSMALSLKRYRGQLYGLNTVYKIAKAVMGTLPASDLYILENYRLSKDRDRSLNWIEIQLSSMLTVLMNGTDHDMRNDMGTQKSFFQNASVIDYLYELKVKDERISAGQKLQRILNETINMSVNDDTPDTVVADLSCIKLNMKFEFVNLVFNAQPLRRDALATSFFLALSFIELNNKNLDL